MNKNKVSLTRWYKGKKAALGAFIVGVPFVGSVALAADEWMAESATALTDAATSAASVFGKAGGLAIAAVLAVLIGLGVMYSVGRKASK